MAEEHKYELDYAFMDQTDFDTKDKKSVVQDRMYMLT